MDIYIYISLLSCFWWTCLKTVFGHEFSASCIAKWPTATFIPCTSKSTLVSSKFCDIHRSSPTKWVSLLLLFYFYVSALKKKFLLFRNPSLVNPKWFLVWTCRWLSIHCWTVTNLSIAVSSFCALNVLSLFACLVQYEQYSCSHYSAVPFAISVSYFRLGDQLLMVNQLTDKYPVI